MHGRVRTLAANFAGTVRGGSGALLDGDGGRRHADRLDVDFHLRTGMSFEKRFVQIGDRLAAFERFAADRVLAVRSPQRGNILSLALVVSLDELLSGSPDRVFRGI